MQEETCFLEQEQVYTDAFGHVPTHKRAVRLNKDDELLMISSVNKASFEIPCSLNKQTLEVSKTSTFLRRQYQHRPRKRKPCSHFTVEKLAHVSV